jgi:hypothetical protein
MPVITIDIGNLDKEKKAKLGKVGVVSQPRTNRL